MRWIRLLGCAACGVALAWVISLGAMVVLAMLDLPDLSVSFGGGAVFMGAATALEMPFKRWWRVA